MTRPQEIEYPLQARKINAPKDMQVTLIRKGNERYEYCNNLSRNKSNLFSNTMLKNEMKLPEKKDPFGSMLTVESLWRPQKITLNLEQTKSFTERAVHTAQGKAKYSVKK